MVQVLLAVIVVLLGGLGTLVLLLIKRTASRLDVHEAECLIHQKWVRGRLDKGGAVIERLDERTENMRADVETIKGLLLKGD